MTTTAPDSIDCVGGHEEPVAGEHFLAAGVCASEAGWTADEPEFDIEAVRADPHYRRFVDVLGEMIYEQMEREGTLPEAWRRAPKQGPGKGEEVA